MNDKSLNELKRLFKASIRFDADLAETLEIGDEIKNRDDSISLNDLRDEV